jgi:pyrimidine dimer DNA glycosylase
MPMRMWKVNPKLLCRKHLLGEHVEMHMFIGTLKAGISIQGYIADGLVETQHILRRHDQLAKEMIARGYNHASPIPIIRLPRKGRVDIEANLKELARRCPECKAKIRADAVANRKAKLSLLR